MKLFVSLSGMESLFVHSGGEFEGRVLRVPPVDRRHVESGSGVGFQSRRRIEDHHVRRKTSQRRLGRQSHQQQLGQAGVQQRILVG